MAALPEQARRIKPDHERRMAYRLKLKASLALEVRRIALEQIELARSALSRGSDHASAVHDARRSLKRLRASSPSSDSASRAGATSTSWWSRSANSRTAMVA
jgi:hypothetical protein